MHTAAPGWKPKLFVAGDLDGFLCPRARQPGQSAFDQQLLPRPARLFARAFLTTHILPASAVSLVIGNLFYAREARALAIRENRADVCALPYGISLFTVFAYSLLVMLPAQQMALAAGHPKAEADLIAWRAGIAAALGTGLMEAVGGWWANRLRALVPRAALLATPAMVGLLLISGLFFFKCVEFPLIGFTTLGLVIALYYGAHALEGRRARLAPHHRRRYGPWRGFSTAPVRTRSCRWGRWPTTRSVFISRCRFSAISGHPCLISIPSASIILPMGLLLNLISSLQGLESGWRRRAIITRAGRRC